MPTPFQTAPAKLYVTNHPDTPFMVVHRDPTRREKSGRAKRIPKWFSKRKAAETYQADLNEQLLMEGATGVAFDAGLRGDAIAARRVLDAKGHNHVSLQELAKRHTAEAKASAGPAKLIGPLMERFLHDKEFVEGCTPATVQNLSTRVWGWINREEITTVAEVHRERMESLRHRKRPKTPDGKDAMISAHGRKNDMAAVSSFCTWLLEQGEIDHHPLKGLRRPKIPHGPKANYNPEECERLLKAAQTYLNGRWLGTIVVMLFVGGARPSELPETRLTYGRQPLGRIEGGKLRGRANRLVKLMPAATAWLRAAGSPTQVKPINQTARNEIMKLAGLEYSTDVLRHTFISYRVAITQDVGAVALEAGTSQEVIFTNYHKPKPAGEARRWEGLRPALTKPRQPPTVTA